MENKSRKIRITQLIDEDIVNYCKCSMFIGTSKCSFKCCKEAGLSLSVCQNYQLAHKSKQLTCKKIITRYLENNLSEAIVFGGLEPMDTFDEVYDFIELLRCEYGCHDDVVIYTGYTPKELTEQIKKLSNFDNIYMKFGRYKPNMSRRYDPILGVTLASDNQFAMRLS